MTTFPKGHMKYNNDLQWQMDSGFTMYHVYRRRAFFVSLSKDNLRPSIRTRASGPEITQSRWPSTRPNRHPEDWRVGDTVVTVCLRWPYIQVYQACLDNYTGLRQWSRFVYSPTLAVGQRWTQLATGGSDNVPRARLFL